MIAGYFLPINVRQSAPTAANAKVWAMRNGAPAGTLCLVREIVLAMTFDGTAAAGTSLRYDLGRFNGADPTGGALLTPIKRDNTQGASVVTVARVADTGLGVVGAVIEGAFATLLLPASVTGGQRQAAFSASVAVDRDPLFVLAPGEGIGIALGATAIVGQGLSGWVRWDEQT